jgi:hypothetical protein
MNEAVAVISKPEIGTPRFDQKFIEDNQLIERYLDGKLPFKGAQEVEAWCRAHPDYLDQMRLSERTHASLKLLEASGRQADLGEAEIPWWKTIYFQAGLGAVTLACLLGFLALFGKYVLQRSAIEDLQQRVEQGSLLPPATARGIRLQPDRAPGIHKAKVLISVKGKAELINLRLDLSYTRLNTFRVQVEKQDQGRAIVIENLLKDSNGDLKVTFNSSAMAAGTYDVVIEGLPFRGAPIAEGWLRIERYWRE